MGCAQSTIESDLITRCKERRGLIRTAVAARHAFAAAHSSYAASLKNTGATLTDFAHGEPLPATSAAASSASSSHPSSLPQLPVEPPLPPPPPPPPNFPLPPPLVRSASMPDLPVQKPSKTLPEPSIPEEDPVPDASKPPLPASEGSSTLDYIFSVDQNTLRSSLAPENPEIEENGSNKIKGKVSVAEGPPEAPEKIVEEPPPPSPKHVKKAKQEASEGKKGKMVATVPPRSLFQILSELDDHFLKASESAHEVSKMLEATRIHYHSNFADNQGHIEYSARLMRAITWNKPSMPNADDGKDNFNNDERETLATVLDKMLAWEKKLCDEVKASEIMKMEYQRKNALLNKQKKHGTKPETLERTKAAVSHLQTKYTVDIQSLDSTVSEINQLRDDQLYPKLVELIDGMATMWESMHVHHESQLKISAGLRAIDISQSPKETTEQHYERTYQLWKVATEWHSQLQKLITHQKECVEALTDWLKLNLIPMGSSLNENESSPPEVHRPPLHALLHGWHNHLERLPDELAINAISSFAAVINAIMIKQQEELKLKEKCEDSRKEYMRKMRAFEDWYHKYSQKMATVVAEGGNIENDEGANENNPVAERKLVVEIVKNRFESEQEAHQKLCKQVREKSLASLKIHLPGLFRAISDFAFACSEMYKKLRPIPQEADSSIGVA